jgi:hypothetical protein
MHPMAGSVFLFMRWRSLCEGGRWEIHEEEKGAMCPTSGPGIRERAPTGPASGVGLSRWAIRGRKLERRYHRGDPGFPDPTAMPSAKRKDEPSIRALTFLALTPGAKC